MKIAAAVAALLALAAPALADDVTLDTGEVLHGRLLEPAEGKVVLEHPVLGTLRIDRARVKGTMTDREIREAEAAKAKVEAEKTAPAWKSKLEAGINGSSGNTRARNFIVGVTSERKEPKDVWKLDARWTQSESDGTTTQNRFTSGARKDWILEDPRWSLFGEARYDRDQFQAWTQRGNLAGGAHYDFLKSPDFDLGLRVGASATKEWGSGEDHVRPEGLIGIEGKWRIDAAKELVFQSTYYPDLSDLPEFRTLSTAALSIRLDDKGTMSLRVGVDHEYDTHRSDPFKRADLRYFALLVMDF